MWLLTCLDQTKIYFFVSAAIKGVGMWFWNRCGGYHRSRDKFLTFTIERSLIFMLFFHVIIRSVLNYRSTIHSVKKKIQGFLLENPGFTEKTD